MNQIDINMSATPQTMNTNKKREPSKKRSWVWRYFTNILGEVRCTICNIVMEYYGPTINLAWHLSHGHELSKKTIYASLRQDAGLVSASDSEEESETEELNNGNYSFSKTKKQKLDDKLVDFIACSNQPFSVVQNPQFKKFIEEAIPGYNPPSRFTLSRRLIPLNVFKNFLNKCQV